MDNRMQINVVFTGESYFIFKKIVFFSIRSAISQTSFTSLFLDRIIDS